MDDGGWQKGSIIMEKHTLMKKFGNRSISYARKDIFVDGGPKRKIWLHILESFYGVALPQCNSGKQG